MLICSTNVTKTHSGHTNSTQLHQQPSHTDMSQPPRSYVSSTCHPQEVKHFPTDGGRRCYQNPYLSSKSLLHTTEDQPIPDRIVANDTTARVGSMDTLIQHTCTLIQHTCTHNAHTCTYTCTHTHTHAHVHMHTHMHTYTCTHTCTRTHAHVHMHTHAHIMHTHAHTHSTHMHTHTAHVHMHTHAHIIHTHAHTCMKITVCPFCQVSYFECSVRFGFHIFAFQ